MRPNDSKYLPCLGSGAAGWCWNPRGKILPCIFPCYFCGSRVRTHRSPAHKLRRSLGGRSAGLHSGLRDCRQKRRDFPRLESFDSTQRMDDAQNCGEVRRFSRGLRNRQFGRLGVVQSGGLEPPTSGSTIRRSNQLSYDCQWRRKLGMPAFKSKQRVPLPQTNSAAKTGAQGRPNHS